MIQKICLWASLLLCLCVFSKAQESKMRVAVLDPTTSGIAMDDGTKLAVQELISSTFVNTGRYIIIERSMIDRIIKEQSFQNSDMADNSQATEIGKLAGANKIVLSSVSLVGGRNMLSIKVIDITTACIDKQKTKIIGTNDLLDAVEPLTLELLGEQAEYVKQNTVFTQSDDKINNTKTTSSRSSSPKEITTHKIDKNYEAMYEAECDKVDRGIISVQQSGLDKTFIKKVVKRQIVLDGGFMSTLSDDCVLTIDGIGVMNPDKDRAFGNQLACAKVIVVGEGITRICGLVGGDVEYVKLPSTLEIIDDECFKGCSKLKAVNMPPSVRRLGKEAFSGCEQLMSMVLPASIEHIESGAFKGCKSLRAITLPDTIIAIPDQLFKDCKSLNEVILPSNSITTIGKEAFCACESVQKLVIPNSVISVGEGCFKRMKSLYDIHLPEKIISIPADVFADCMSLTKISCPAGVRVVGNNAFENCENLIEVRFLSENISEFGEDCFSDCKRLTNFILYSLKPPTCPKEGIFDGDKEYLKRVTLKVHPSRIGDYRDAKFWKNFEFISTINL